MFPTRRNPDLPTRPSGSGPAGEKFGIALKFPANSQTLLFIQQLKYKKPKRNSAGSQCEMGVFGGCFLVSQRTQVLPVEAGCFASNALGDQECVCRLCHEGR